MQTIPVFYRPEMVADSKGYSPSASKPAAVVQDWQQHNFPIEIVEPRRCAEHEIASVHRTKFVQGVLRGEIRNGHGNTCPEVAKSCRFTTGSMLCAALRVLETGGVACSPTSGFHHAGYDYASGFCTFNGLAIAARAALRVAKSANIRLQVLVIDGDAHDPDGLRDIQKRYDDLRERMTIVASADFGEPEAFLDAISCAFDMLQESERCLVLYQAGADAHEDDPLRAGNMSTEQMYVRDAVVFREANRRNIPLVWNLAGGYQREEDGSIPKVLELHRNTMQACCDVYVKESVVSQHATS